MLDLGHPGDAYAHGGGDLLLAQGQLLADLGELMPAGLGEQPVRTRLDFHHISGPDVVAPPDPAPFLLAGGDASRQV
jgi:hypothetical protein